MGKTENVRLTKMCMVCDKAGNVLVQERNDPAWSGLTFPGGHVEPGESFVDSVIREVREETGLTIESPRLCGVKHFHTLDENRYIVFLFKADTFSGELKDSDEGAVRWIPLRDYEKFQWIPDFEDLLKIYRDDEVSELFYYRRDGKLERAFK